MTSKQVVITIEPDGSTTIDAQNFKGKGCADATQAMAIALAGTSRDDKDDRKKPDYYATVPGCNTGKI